MITGLAGGAIAGMLGGLAGLGGGLVYVPLFFALMPRSSELMAAPVFASMVGILLTGFHSFRVHQKLGHLRRDLLIQIFPWLCCGAVVGLWSTLRVSETLVLLGLGLLNFWISWDYGRVQKSQNPRSPIRSFLALPIGYVSGLLGIGGGTMLVPWLRRHASLREAVGTAAACGFFMAATAVSINLLLDENWRGILSPSFPFMAGAWLGILAVTRMSSRFAARLHQRYSDTFMHMLLKTLFAIIGSMMLLAAAFAFWDG